MTKPFQIRIEETDLARIRMWAKKKAVELGRFSLNAWVCETLIKNIEE